MRRRTLWALGTAVGGLVAAAALALNAQAQPSVAMTRVLIYDNGGSFMPGDEYTGQWGFTPHHYQVAKGESIEFVNPAGNAQPHTVTSITASGQPPNRTLTHGAAFDSSPTRADVIRPGSSWTLDTSGLDAGQYTYYCWLHPWMVGSITVTPPE
jgi:plastocyanin